NNFSASLNELAATSTQLGKNTEQIVETSRNAIVLANQGNQAVVDSLNSIENIQQTNVGTSEKFKLLVEKVENIAKVLLTITKIADKTNLLSVNASIEAVKAGESGKGFGVVAAEIRRLADQTVLASQDIENIITEIQKAASTAMMSMDKLQATTMDGLEQAQTAGTSFQELIEAVQTIGPSLEEMREGILQQAQSTVQMTHSLQQIQHTADENRLSSEQTSQTTVNLSQMAQQQMEIAQRFKVEKRRSAISRKDPQFRE
ncbi:MAG: hypothetical protein HQM12_16820, partial [SAR324 cluster bacterium]|nr:hypothetical protein [SAR324 cluster bacterium]